LSDSLFETGRNPAARTQNILSAVRETIKSPLQQKTRMAVPQPVLLLWSYYGPIMVLKPTNQTSTGDTINPEDTAQVQATEKRVTVLRGI
jgi:hypothetical protein